MVDINFLKQLEFHRIPEWSNKYIEYEKLFYIIVDLEAATVARNPKRSLQEQNIVRRTSVESDFELQTQLDGYDIPETDLSIFSGDRTDITPDSESCFQQFEISSSPELLLKDWKTQLRNGLSMVDQFIKKKEK